MHFKLENILERSTVDGHLTYRNAFGISCGTIKILTPLTILWNLRLFCWDRGGDGKNKLPALENSWKAEQSSSRLNQIPSQNVDDLGSTRLSRRVSRIGSPQPIETKQHQTTMQ